MAGYKVAVFLTQIIFLVIHTVTTTSEMNRTSALNPTTYFENIDQDASLVTWAHAVNSEDELNEALNSPVMMLETDISSGYVVGENSSSPIPIMAHPPATTSDISLKKWLQTVIAANKNKGIKLDFKNITVVEDSLKLLKSYENQISFPVFINADISTGPVNSTATPVDADQFLLLVQEYYPQCILSVGWTTSYDGNESWYTWQEMLEMIKTLRKHNVQQEISFPIRAIYLKQSYPQLRFLTNVVPNSGITVWSAKDDPVNASVFTSTLINYNRDSVYYDLPESLNASFVQLKTSLFFKPELRRISTSTWVSDNDGCALTTPETVVLNGNCFVSNLDELQGSVSNPITVKGVVQFLEWNLAESLAIGLRSPPWLWVRIYSNGRIVKPNLDEVNNLQTDTPGQCFRFEIVDKGGRNPVKVQITLSEPPSFTSSGEGVSFDVDLPDSIDEGIKLAFNASGSGIKVVHSLDVAV